MESKYNRAKLWQLVCFDLNNVASNVYLFLLGFVNLYAGNVAGLAVMFVSNVIMLSRFWDGVTDPIIGFIMDKTSGKFGKFRPFMLLGNLIMFGTTLLMFTTTHLVPEGFRGIYWILVYMVYIIGYTFQNTATRGGQTVLTNDPKQRPIFARIDSIAVSLEMAGLAYYLTTYLTAKHHGFTGPLFIEAILVLGVISLVLTILGIIAISEKDKPENYEALGENAHYGFKDIFRIITRNRAIQMLVIAASTDKLAMQIRRNSVVGIMLYGIIMGNYSLNGKMSLITLIPGIIIVTFGTGIAAKFSSKSATIIFTWASIIFTTLLGALLIFGDPTQISLEHIGFMTIAFFVLYTVSNGTNSITTSLALPMIADCADYEMYQSGNYVPGLMGAVFGFFDKLVSSFSSTIIGWCCVLIGYADRFPTQDDPLTSGIFWVALFLFIGTPLIGWVASLIAMKFYPLDKEKIIEVQDKIAAMKAEGAAK